MLLWKVRHHSSVQCNYLKKVVLSISDVPTFHVEFSSTKHHSGMVNDIRGMWREKGGKFEVLASCDMQCGAVIKQSIFSNLLKNTPHSSPVRAFDWYFAWVPLIIYATSHYIGPRYNGTPLYYVVSSKCTYIRFGSVFLSRPPRTIQAATWWYSCHLYHGQQAGKLYGVNCWKCRLLRQNCKLRWIGNLLLRRGWIVWWCFIYWHTQGRG